VRVTVCWCTCSFLGDNDRPDKISNADIAAICLEAGMQAVRKNRYTRNL